METATLLAGFAFESYNQPELNWEVATDGTRTGMLSPAFLREYYDGVLAIDKVKATLFRPAGMLPLQPLDTYLVMQVGNGEPLRTEVVKGSESPEWSSGQVLYVRDAEDATLVLSIYYEANMLGGDPKLLGRTQVKVSELRSNSIQLWGQQMALSGGGRVELKAQFIEFDSSAAKVEDQLASLASSARGADLGALSSQLADAWGQWRVTRAVEATTGTKGERRGSTLASRKKELIKPKTWFEEQPRGPRGAAGVDWSALASRLGGAAMAGDAFEACCFVENTRTNTQCGIWRQSESKTLILSFRGTQQESITDIITDLSFVQRPATQKANERSVAQRKAEAQTREAAEELLRSLQVWSQSRGWAGCMGIATCAHRPRRATTKNGRRYDKDDELAKQGCYRPYFTTYPNHTP